MCVVGRFPFAFCGGSLCSVLIVTSRMGRVTLDILGGACWAVGRVRWCLCLWFASFSSGGGGQGPGGFVGFPSCRGLVVRLGVVPSRPGWFVWGHYMVYLYWALRALATRTYRGTYCYCGGAMGTFYVGRGVALVVLVVWSVGL